MDTVLKDSYEVSIWQRFWTRSGTTQEGTWDEQKLCIIGSSDRDDWASIFNPILTLDIYGQETFKFDLYSQYQTINGIEINPYLTYLYNEAYIKVKFREQWHTFVIREKTEKHEKNIVLNFTCEGLAQAELGKSGYDLTFSEDLSNNVQSASEFLTTILDGSDWSYDTTSTASLLETNEEQAYIYNITSAVNITTVSYTSTQEVEGTTKSYSEGKFYIPLSIYNQQIGKSETSTIKVYGRLVSDLDLPTVYPYSLGQINAYMTLTAEQLRQAYYTKYRIENITKNATTVYNEVLERYVNVWEKNSSSPLYYSYQDFYDEKPYIAVYSHTIIGTTTGATVKLGFVVLHADDAYGYYFQKDSEGYGKIVYTPSVEYTWELTEDTSKTVQISAKYKVENSETIMTIDPLKVSIKCDSASNITILDADSLYDTLSVRYQTLYFEEGDETNTSTTPPEGYSQVCSYEKYRTLNAERSNRFNLTQDIAELFEVWCKYNITYDANGKIDSKKVKLSDEYGQTNLVGFRYEQNLKSVQRDLKSNEIVSKLYVEDLENEAAQDGICSILNSSYNPSGEQYLLDFNYFIKKGLIDIDALYYDLYAVKGYPATGGPCDSDGKASYDGHYTILRRLNNEYNTIAATFYNYGSDSLNSQIIALKRSIVIDSAKIDEMEDGTTSKTEAENKLKQDKAKLEALQAQLDTYQEYLLEINQKRQLEEIAFFKKYGCFIREGAWTGENYIDADAYFYDAQKVITQNSEPKASYTLNTQDLTNYIDLETGYQYSAFEFCLGDKSHIYDTELFGEDEIEVIVSSITYHLEEQSKNTIEIQNFSTQFKDLFSKLNATVQSYDLNKNAFSKVDSFTGNGSLTYEALQGSFNRNRALALSNFEQKITYDDTGITLLSAADSSASIAENQYQVKIMSQGLVLSSDYGDTWKTGIYAGHINTDLLSAGVINAGNIHVISSTSTNGVIFNDQGIFGGTWDTNNLNNLTNIYYSLNGNGLAIYNGAVGSVKMSNSFIGVSSGTNFTTGIYGGDTYKGYKGYNGTSLIDNSPIRFFANTTLLSNNEQSTTKKTSFYITESGFLYAKNAYITGHIKAVSGSFTGALYADSLYLYSEDNESYRQVGFSNDGYINAQNLISSATITADQIAARTITASEIATGAITASKIAAGAITANNIAAGWLDVGNISLADAHGGFCYGQGNDGTQVTSGIKMYTNCGGNINKSYFITTTAGCRMQYGDESIWVSSSGCYANNGIIQTSDRRFKNNINYNFSRYNNFYYNLKPATYELIKDNTKRIHTGFIAQDVHDALQASNLTYADFAGFVDTSKHNVSENNYYALAYTDFISLNTHAIHELNKRVSELENLLENQKE